jgi:hypothetical protein
MTHPPDVKGTNVERAQTPSGPMLAPSTTDAEFRITPKKIREGSIIVIIVAFSSTIDRVKKCVGIDICYVVPGSNNPLSFQPVPWFQTGTWFQTGYLVPNLFHGLS